jgi:hypothetical protein
MHKPHKKETLRQIPPQKHSRNPSAQRQRDSHPRLTLCCSPPLPIRKSNHYLSSPNSLEKDKRKDRLREKDSRQKTGKRKLAKGKKPQEATR